MCFLKNTPGGLPFFQSDIHPTLRSSGGVANRSFPFHPAGKYQLSKLHERSERYRKHHFMPADVLRRKFAARVGPKLRAFQRERLRTGRPSEESTKSVYCCPLQAVLDGRTLPEAALSRLGMRSVLQSEYTHVGSAPQSLQLRTRNTPAAIFRHICEQGRQTPDRCRTPEATDRLKKPGDLRSHNYSERPPSANRFLHGQDRQPSLRLIVMNKRVAANNTLSDMCQAAISTIIVMSILMLRESWMGDGLLFLLLAAIFPLLYRPAHAKTAA